MAVRVLFFWGRSKASELPQGLKFGCLLCLAFCAFDIKPQKTRTATERPATCLSSFRLSCPSCACVTKRVLHPATLLTPAKLRISVRSTVIVHATFFAGITDLRDERDMSQEGRRRGGKTGHPTQSSAFEAHTRRTVQLWISAARRPICGRLC